MAKFFVKQRLARKIGASYHGELAASHGTGVAPATAGLLMTASQPPSSKEKPANGFRRTRRDHASETAEDYVEAIASIAADNGQCRGADLARLFGVSHVTVTKTIARLQSEGLVETEPYGPIALTTRGKRLASSSRERHDLVLEFLRAIGVDEETAQIDAEGIEHHVSRKTLDCFRKLIDRGGE